MNIEKRQLLVECLTTILAIALWRGIFYLLGLQAMGALGLKEEAGSIIVLTMCFMTCRSVAFLFAHFFIPRSMAKEDNSVLKYSEGRVVAPTVPREVAPASQRAPSALFRTHCPSAHVRVKRRP